jgi:hypothetical protein
MSIPIVEAISPGPRLRMDSIVNPACINASLRPSAISNI